MATDIPEDRPSILDDERVKRAVDGLASEIEKTNSYNATDKLSVLINTIEKKVAEAIDVRIKQTAKTWAWRFGGIGAGIAFTMLALGFLGWKVKDPSEYIRKAYTPDKIYGDIKNLAQQDIPIALASREVTKDAQIENIATRFREANDIGFIKAFENPKLVTPKAVYDFGSKRPLEVKVSRLRPDHYNERTSGCEIKPNKKKLQAILLRPTLGAAYFPEWLKCKTGYPQIVLEVDYGSDPATSKRIYVELIGVNSRNELTGNCISKDNTSLPAYCENTEIQLTDAAADALMEASGQDARRAWIKVANATPSRH